MDELKKQEYNLVLNNSSIVHSFQDSGKYFKITTNILIDETQDYLNLYLIFYDDGDCLTDSKEIYRIFSDYYDLAETGLRKIAQKLDLDFDKYQYFKTVDKSNIIFEIEKYDKIISEIVSEYQEI